MVGSNSIPPYIQPPATGVIRVTFGQSPDHVKVVRQDNMAHDLERMVLLHIMESVPQDLYSLRIGEQFPPPACDDGEEIGSSGNIIAAVIHTGIIDGMGFG